MASQSAAYRNLRVQVIKGFVQPWSMAWLPDGTMLVAERPGRLRIVRNGVLDPRPVAGVPEVHAQGLQVLMDVALHPRFSENGLVAFAQRTIGAGKPDDALPFLRAQRLILLEEIDIEPVSTVRGHPPCGRVRMRKVPHHFKRGHLVADGCRTRPQPQPLRQPLGTHRFGVVDVRLDDRVEDLMLARIEIEHDSLP